MFTKKVRQETALDKAIDEATRYLDPNSDDYLQQIEAVERLTKLRDGSSKWPSPDTLAIVAANILGIIMILEHERAHVITTRAFNLVKTLR